jgi:hypothetical protein
MKEKMISNRELPHKIEDKKPHKTVIDFRKG